MANDWVDASDLAGMSRGGNLLGQMGYDREELMADPSLRAQMMQKVAGPYSATAPAQQSATPTSPTVPQIPNPRSPNGNDISAPPGAPRLINRQEPTIQAPPPRPLPATLGGGAAPTQASVAGATPPTSSAVSPSGTPTPSVETQNSRQAVGNLLAPEPEFPDTTKEDAMIAAKSMPINPNTTIGGKKIYKEGFWGEVGRGLNDARLGFAGRPDEVTPYGAPNAQYGLDDQTRQAQLGLANKQRADAIAKFKEQADLRRQQDTASKDAGDISNTAAKLPNETTTANADMLRAQNETPNNKAKAAQEINEDTLFSRKTQISDPKNPISKASASGKAYFMATGRLPDPKQPSADEVATSQALMAFQRENGHQPQTLEDYRQVRQAAKGEKDAGVNMLVPDGKGGMVSKMIQPGDAVPEGTTSLSGKPAIVKADGTAPTVADRNRASLAHVANDNLDQVQDVVTRRPDLFGPAAGRLSNVDQMIGSNDPDLIALGNAVHNFAMANAGIHGSRSFENVRAAETALLNNLKSGPKGVQGGIDENRQNLQAIIDRVEGKKKNTTPPPPGSKVRDYSNLK